jgi:transcriptional regulator with XRE-family HTH domain
MRLRDPDALRAYVRLMGLSERALAARAGVGHATLNHLLSGRRTTCRHSTARAIEAVLACPKGVFFHGPDDALARRGVTRVDQPS